MDKKLLLAFVSAIIAAGRYAHSSQGKPAEDCIEEAETLLYKVDERCADPVEVKRGVGRPRKSQETK